MRHVRAPKSRAEIARRIRAPKSRAEIARRYRRRLRLLAGSARRASAVAAACGAASRSLIAASSPPVAASDKDASVPSRGPSRPIGGRESNIQRPSRLRRHRRFASFSLPLFLLCRSVHCEV